MDAEQAGLLQDADPAELGARIRAARIAKGLTQGELAGTTVSVGYVSRIEAGQRRPNAAVLKTFAATLGTTPVELILGISGCDYQELRLGLDYAELALETGQAAEAETRAGEVVDRARAESVSCFLDRARLVHARALEALGRLDDAIIELEDLVRELAPGVLRVSVGIALSRCYRDSGDFARAIETAETMLDALEGTDLESADEAVQLAVTLAAAHFERGDTGQAVRVCRRALTKAEQLDSPAARAAAYWNTSVMEAERHNVAAAVELAERAIALLREGDSSRNVARLQAQLGMFQLRLDPPALGEARRNLEQAAEQYAWANGTVADLARNSLALARVHLFEGDVDQARDLAAQARDGGAQVPLVAAEASIIEGLVHAAGGDADAARSAYQRAVALLTGLGADREAAQLWVELADLLEEAGELDAARAAYRSATAAAGLRTTTALGRLGNRVRESVSP